jgi:ABC-type branched-subunit amino acid transport system ATPase component
LFGLQDESTSLLRTCRTARPLEIAVAGDQPTVLLLEPAAGMNTAETDALHQMILQVRQQFG